MEKINPKIANLANTAEKLFRDEYFDQCITQTRKMAEVMTRNVLGSKANDDDTFDDMLYKLKTISNNNFREQEFITDMYFLKKQGNVAVHSQNSQNSGKIALECLEHAFEASVNYAYAITHNDKINKLIFDEKLLVLGEKSNSLQQEYQEKLNEIEQQKEKVDKKTTNTLKKEKVTKRKTENTEKTETTSNSHSLLNKSIIISLVISSVVLIVLFLLSSLTKSVNKSLTSMPENNKQISDKHINIQNINYDSKYKMSDTFSKLR